MPMTRQPTGRITPERQKIRDRANMLCDRSAAKTAWHERKSISLACDFPWHPARTFRKFCPCCRNWLTPKYWRTETSAKEGRCDQCCRAGWLARNKRARHKGTLTKLNTPKGWGFW